MRAVELDIFNPKPNDPTKVFIEVPKIIRNQATDIIKGKALKTERELQTGHPSHSTRIAALSAFHANVTSREQFNDDARIARKQNTANHGSPPPTVALGRHRR